MYNIVFPEYEPKGWIIPEEEKYYEEHGTVDSLLHSNIWPLVFLCRNGIYVRCNE